jgi:two-component system sensor histidine kinase YesM
MRILLVFLAALCVYATAAAWINRRFINDSTRAQAYQGTQQSIEMFMSGIEMELINARNISNALLFNPDIARWLKTQETDRDIALIQSANQALLQSFSAFTDIASVYIFDEDCADINASNHITFNTVPDIHIAPWYDRARELHGRPYISLNADGTMFANSGQNNISYIRQILDTLTMMPAGYLIINFNERLITNITSRVDAKHGTHFYLLDGNGQSIIHGQNIPPEALGIPPEGEVRSAGGKAAFWYQVSFSPPDYPALGWTIITGTPYSEIRTLPNAAVSFLLPLLISVVLFIIGSVYTASRITRPVQGLIASMQDICDGQMNPIPSDHRRDELGKLEERYNAMIASVKAAFERQADTEREKGRYEREFLSEQFHLRLLLNSLHTVSAYIHNGNLDRAGRTLTDLNHFYSHFYTVGQLVIPLRQEIDNLRGYLSLQKTQHPNMIDDRYDIAPETEELPVLRNILLPVAHSSVLKGILPAGMPGILSVEAKLAGDELVLTVRDTGAGIDEERLALLNEELSDGVHAGYGLRGTIYRLRLHYNRSDLCDVTSLPDQGTSVHIRVPLDALDEEASLNASP